MYDKYMIVGDEFRNVQKDGQVTGFQVGVRLPYYRGVVLSLVGDTVLAVDGQNVPIDTMSVRVGGKTFSLAQLGDEPVAKWEFGEVGIVSVDRPGGLEPGEHTVELQQHMKISYVPGGFWGKDQKTLRLVE